MTCDYCDCFVTVLKDLLRKHGMDVKMVTPCPTVPHRALPCPVPYLPRPRGPARPPSPGGTGRGNLDISGRIVRSCKPFTHFITFHHISSHHISLTEAKTAITIDNFDVPCDFTNTDAHTDRDTRGNSKLNTSQPRHINRTKSGRVVHSFQNRPSSIDSVTSPLHIHLCCPLFWMHSCWSIYWLLSKPLSRIICGKISPHALLANHTPTIPK